jgi:hypothetical protein
MDEELQAIPSEATTTDTTTDSGNGNNARTTQTGLGDMKTSGGAQSNARASGSCCIKFSQQKR